MHVKDPIPPEWRKGVVYQISCSDCPATYVGQTGCTMGHGIKEHKYALTSGNVDKSAVAEHLVMTGHTIKWEEARESMYGSLLYTCVYTCVLYFVCVICH